MKNATLVKLGIGGSIAALLCCFTPVLFILLSATGLAALAGWIDSIVMSALALFMGITVYALLRRRKEAACCAVPPPQSPKQTPNPAPNQAINPELPHA